jgi:hypothetical protein
VGVGGDEVKVADRGREEKEQDERKSGGGERENAVGKAAGREGRRLTIREHVTNVEHVLYRTYRGKEGHKPVHVPRR